MRLSKYGGDRGFSLVELIVVILIMGVMATTAAVSVSILYNADAERAAKKFCSMMNIARAKAMASDSNDVSAELYQTEDGNYMRVTSKDSHGNVVEDNEKLSNYKVDIIVGHRNTDPETGGTKFEVDEDEDEPKIPRIIFKFKKSNGGIASVKTETLANGFAGAEKTNPEDAEFCSDVIFAGSSVYNIIVVPATGRCYINDGE